MTLKIPDTHQDLLLGAVHAVLTTMHGTQPQATLVWADYDGTHVLVNTSLERQKARNMQADPKVTLLIVDPANGERWIEVRGTVAAITQEGAIDHADRMTQLYTGKQHFYGDVYTADQQHKETRVIVRIAPVKVNRDAAFSEPSP
jgi:PPOX class probable F420-dependent enzyme